MRIQVLLLAVGQVALLSAGPLTPTDAGPAGPVIAAAGDIACDPANPSFKGGAGTPTACRQRVVSDLLIAGAYDAVLTMGDNQYEDGALTKFLASYAPSWGRVKAKTRPAPGNHDYLTPGASGYYDYFGWRAGNRAKGYYSFNIGTWHLVALNSNCSAVGGCGAGSPQERWLRRDLAAHTNVCTLAYWHHPRFSSGLHGSDTRYSALWRALYDAGADVVLSGHDHHYERFAPQTPDGVADPVRGIRQFVTGTGGRSLYAISVVRPNSEVRNTATFGILELTLLAGAYRFRFVPEPGKTFADDGVALCH